MCVFQNSATIHVSGINMLLLVVNGMSCYYSCQFESYSSSRSTVSFFICGKLFSHHLHFSQIQYRLSATSETNVNHGTQCNEGLRQPSDEPSELLTEPITSAEGREETRGEALEEATEDVALRPRAANLHVLDEDVDQVCMCYKDNSVNANNGRFIPAVRM